MLKSFSATSATSGSENVTAVTLSSENMPNGTSSFSRSVTDKSRNFQDEVLQYTPLPSSEDYCIATSFSFKMEPYVRGKLSFEDPEIEKNRHGVTPRMLEVYDYLTLKLDEIYNGRLRPIPRLYSKEWNIHYSKICPDEKKREDNENDDGDEKRSRKRMQRIEKPDKQKKMKFNRDRD